MATRISNSTNHFIDTNVLLRFANDDSGESSADIAQILEDATGATPRRKIWISHVLFGELRPSCFRPVRFGDFDEFVRYVRGIGTVVTPDPNVMLRVARMRDIAWRRSNAMPNEKNRRLTLGDAIHLASALWVKEAHKVPDLEFLTFDNKSETSFETDVDEKSLPILDLERYADRQRNDPDVVALVNLHRARPILRQTPIDFSR
ncbi:type II toxin-antitoxin system VapC family toxin [Martelella radicis]|uniref:Putative nucleic acid-binding protein n=1 Tax=Martelella radicis TaxID=1397476 RepID=A0A7W6P972_9HYPH|nr:PIN domain-containing protein [Martelella radicis]MBB4121046.1 putative nucleic acid-binding protein [Martelella radicis]